MFIYDAISKELCVLACLAIIASDAYQIGALCSDRYSLDEALMHPAGQLIRIDAVGVLVTIQFEKQGFGHHAVYYWGGTTAGMSICKVA